MCTPPRLLFPHLPPELRNEVYHYLSTPSIASEATNSGLPLKLKKYECKHTEVHIYPVHFGSTSLLELQKDNFQEACEYNSWLLANALELRIGVVFKNRVNTFVQADWDKNMEKHLRKLAKQHPWLTKVSKYDIQILWEASDGPLKSRKNKRTAGQIPRDIAKTLTGLMQEDVRRKNGDVTVRLYLEHWTVVSNAMSNSKFGHADFLSMPKDLSGFRKLTREVWEAPYQKDVQRTPCLPTLMVPPAVQEKELFVVEGASVKWAFAGKGNLAVRKTVGLDGVLNIMTGNVRREDDQGMDYVLMGLVEECLGRR